MDSCGPSFGTEAPTPQRLSGGDGDATAPTSTCVARKAGLAKADKATNVSQGENAPSAFASMDGDIDAQLAYVEALINAPELSAQAARDVMKDAIGLWNAHINPGFLQYRKSVADGQGYAAIEWRDGEPGGATIFDAAGNEFIDCLGGFGCYNVGHSHPAVVAAVQAQLRKQPLHSQELLDPLRAYCAALLCATLPGDLRYAFFTNSGTESVECALKMAMLATGRRHFIGVVGAFHGKSLGSLSGTSKACFRKPFGGGLLPFTHVAVNDVAGLTAAFESAAFTGNEIAGFLVEPVLGEGGIHVCSDAFLRAGRALCDKYGSALIFDEVQSGMGRCGTMWACQASGVAPDIMAIGKAFGGGVTAAGACVGTRRMWSKFFDNPFLHTTTFGGNPMSMAAAIATLAVLRREGLVEAAAAKGEYLMGRLQALAGVLPAGMLKTVRGRGLMIGLEFVDDATGYEFARGCFAELIVISGTLVNSRVIRVEPPLTITYAQLDTVVERMARVLAGMATGRGLAMLGPVPPQPHPQTAPSSGSGQPAKKPQATAGVTLPPGPRGAGSTTSAAASPLMAPFNFPPTPASLLQLPGAASAASSASSASTASAGPSGGGGNVPATDSDSDDDDAGAASAPPTRTASVLSGRSRGSSGVTEDVRTDGVGSAGGSSSGDED